MRFSTRSARSTCRSSPRCPGRGERLAQALQRHRPQDRGHHLCFSLGLPAMPVDTHIYRVSRRLGLIGPKVSADQAHDILEPMVAPGTCSPSTSTSSTTAVRYARRSGPGAIPASSPSAARREALSAASPQASRPPAPQTAFRQKMSSI